MTTTVLLCTDGSDLAITALSRALEVVAPPDRVVVATVVELVHPVDVVGTGMAGGVLSVADADREDADRLAIGRQALDTTCERLGLATAETVVLQGSAGAALCDLATSLPASTIVLGTRGRGGLRRAVLGSVSDHVVRNAPCPVVISGAG
ncbi:MAG: universal stress protein [Ilumatobacteraceae bacterium]